MRSWFRTLFGISLALALAIPAAVEARQKRPMSFVDILELPSIQDPQLSPDGKRILFVMDTADWKSNRRIGHICRIDADGGNQIQLTAGERGESSPRWAPDGRTIAFLARRDGDVHNQIYLLAPDGGEARRLTTHETAPGSLSWAPDGQSILFTASDAKSADEKEKDRLQDDVYSFEETNFEQRHLWTSDRQGKTRKVTDGDYSVTIAGALAMATRFCETWSRATSSSRIST